MTNYNFDDELGVSRQFIQRLIKSRVYKPHQLDIANFYVAQKHLNMVRAGEIVDTQNGWVHGVWCSNTKQLRYFTDTEWFLPYEEYEIE